MYIVVLEREKISADDACTMFNGEREIPGRQKVVRGSNVPVLTSHAGLNPRSKSGYEREARVINAVMNTAASDVLKAMMNGNEKLTRKYIDVLQRAGY